jgi:hypothetical protein
MPLRTRCHALQFLRFSYRLFGAFKPLGDLDEPFGGSRPAFFPTLDLGSSAITLTAHAYRCRNHDRRIRKAGRRLYQSNREP